jgi:hypothetical protein
MLVTATRIAEWAGTREAQASLPRLIRRLVCRQASITQVAIPAGDSVNTPGWDGEVVCEHGSPWVPKGQSYWEWSVESGATNKSNRDYAKRTKQTPQSTRATSTLIVVSARKWGTKKKWRAEKQAAGDWADVRAYDADDLEHWLEECPAVALQFAEELGITGPGVESVARYWETWSQQSDPPLSAEAVFTDREAARGALLAEVRDRAQSDQPALYVVKADSAEEAAAFACAAVLGEGDLAGDTVVVTDHNGWRFVEANQSIKVAIAASPEIAKAPARRKGLVTIIPYPAGYATGAAAGRHPAANLTLPRPRIQEYEKALTRIGLDEADTRRLAATTGRSWAVFRRRRSTNPAIQNPAWLTEAQSAALATVCLLGAWSADKAEDRDIVARVSGRTYEEMERDLLHLAGLNDAPVLKLGAVWKAKSPLELFDLYAGRITRQEIDRFFGVARDVLLPSDPALELPDDQRWMAQVYGKSRLQSDLLIRALCDNLAKLAVRGPEISALAAIGIGGRVAAFVRELLKDADDMRWLSLSSLLSPLAEAAPNEFLSAIEASLALPNAPVARLFTETTTGITGRCWYAGLLWALEALAWAPERMPRVAIILATLTRSHVKSTWANSPRESLLGTGF